MLKAIEDSRRTSNHYVEADGGPLKNEAEKRLTSKISIQKTR